MIPLRSIGHYLFRPPDHRHHHLPFREAIRAVRWTLVAFLSLPGPGLDRQAAG